MDAGSWYVVQMWTQDPHADGLQNLAGTSWSKDISVVKFWPRCDQFLERYEPHCGKMPYLAMLKNPEGRWVTKFNQFLVICRYISCKIFMKICLAVSAWSCLEVANRQVERQTSLAEVVMHKSQVVDISVLELLPIVSRYFLSIGASIDGTFCMQYRYGYRRYFFMYFFGSI